MLMVFYNPLFTLLFRMERPAVETQASEFRYKILNHCIRNYTKVFFFEIKTLMSVI